MYLTEDISQERAKWFQIRFLYPEIDKSYLKNEEKIKEAILSRESMDQEILKWIVQETFDDDESWHIRWSIEKEDLKREYLAIRVRANDNRILDLKSAFHQFGETLKDTDIILDYDFDDDQWWKSDEEWPSHCRNYEEWARLTKILYHVSNVISELVKFPSDRRQFFFYEKVVHHLHNMMHIQDSFHPLDIGVKGSFQRCFLMNYPKIRIGNYELPWNPGWDS